LAGHRPASPLSETSGNGALKIGIFRASTAAGS